ncbi:hypothetical protein B5P44_01390 [Mycobacterium sp. CBMA 213]|uniref:Uncharacterized protein n=1 Tax=Mycolicibacterium sp. CBMA 213 TaxID=1968788 RepID=A0A343VRS5_9MYCO|nr:MULTISPECIES: hypothetical protein [unclassified Mycolicibacterium]AVN58599.1 hypothetical protein B5P44_p00307 [Mycolicibacterium sp. CBMA 213]MUL61236.1 hypothetical protein [Mycolicibacterium sp. CBMA 335]MUM03472.1 hypothetical protein [Mycolicibacterium sp. CBMA 213]
MTQPPGPQGPSTGPPPGPFPTSAGAPRVASLGEGASADDINGPTTRLTRDQLNPQQSPGAPPAQWPPAASTPSTPPRTARTAPAGPVTPQLQVQFTQPKPARPVWKWAGTAAAFGVAVAVGVGGTLLILAPGKTDKSNSAAANPFGVASANDTGPAGVIAEDASCEPLQPIYKALYDGEQNGWQNRNIGVPKSAWNDRDEKMFTDVGNTFRKTADATVALAKLTQHRTMRELYGQFAAYARLYADHIPTYTPNDDNLALASIASMNMLNAICQAITNGAAENRGRMINAAAAPTSVAPAADPDKPALLMDSPDPQCEPMLKAVDVIDADPTVINWQKEDYNVTYDLLPESWKADNRAVMPIWTNFSDQMETMGRSFANPIAQDIAVLQAQYGRAYVQGIPTYNPPDNQLYSVLRAKFFRAACKYVTPG